MLDDDDDEFINGALYVYDRKKRRKRKADEDEDDPVSVGGRGGTKRNKVQGNPLLKYFAAPIYVLCGYAILQCLGDSGTVHPLSEQSRGDKMKPEDDRKEPLVEAGHNTLFVLVWLGTSALNLVTAPLVEPRYFILPWIVWRLHVQSRSHLLLLVETAWLLAINAATMYIFLNWDFEWPQEPGKAQRFLW